MVRLKHQYKKISWHKEAFSWKLSNNIHVSFYPYKEYDKYQTTNLLNLLCYYLRKNLNVIL